jgi:hypothetical protein
MSFKDLIKLKKEVTHVEVSKSYKYFVFCHDLFSLQIYHSLLEQHGPEEVCGACVKELDRDAASFLGPSLIRGQEDRETLSTHYNHINIENIQSSTFYKDQRFFDFGKRAKPYSLLKNEEYFVNDAINLPEKDLFPSILNEEFWKKIEDHIEVLPIKKITYENDEWAIMGEDHHLYSVENLIWGASPWDFYKLIKDSKDLSNQFIQFCETTNAPLTLVVKFDFEKVLSNQKGTFFIPISQTHDWGNFIGEFKTEENGRQSVEFIAFIDEKSSTEEEITKKIRILKKYFEKIFPEFSSLSCTESIFLRPSSLRQKIDDSLFCEPFPSSGKLFFVGAGAPLSSLSQDEGKCEYSPGSSGPIVRGLLSMEKIKKEFSLSN